MEIPTICSYQMVLNPQDEEVKAAVATALTRSIRNRPRVLSYEGIGCRFCQRKRLAVMAQGVHAGH